MKNFKAEITRLQRAYCNACRQLEVARREPVIDARAAILQAAADGWSGSASNGNPAALDICAAHPKSVHMSTSRRRYARRPGGWSRVADAYKISRQRLDALRRAGAPVEDPHALFTFLLELRDSKLRRRLTSPNERSAIAKILTKMV